MSCHCKLLICNSFKEQNKPQMATRMGWVVCSEMYGKYRETIWIKMFEHAFNGFKFGFNS